MRGGKASVPFFAASIFATGMIRPKLGKSGKPLVLSPRRPAGRAQDDAPRWKGQSDSPRPTEMAEFPANCLDQLGDGPIGIDL
jgi:hypothetical protein